MPTNLLPSIEVNPVIQPKASVIWLHGLGADGSDFADIVPQLGLSEDLGIRFVFPHAPVQPITLNGGYPMRAWYDIIGLDMNSREDEAGVRASEQLIRELIRREHTLGIPSNRIVLAGFSQGGAMALHCGLRFEEPLAGILALSTYLPLAGKVESEASLVNRKTPIFMVHGTLDTVLPLAFAQVSHKILKELGYPIEFHTHSMPHSVCPEEIQQIIQWLKARLS